MGEETLAGVVSESEAETPAIETKPLNTEDKLTEINGAKKSPDDDKDFANETAVECEDQTEEKVEKSGEEKIEEQLEEGSKEGDAAKELGRSKEEKNAEEVEDSKEVKSADNLADTEEVTNPDELEESKEEESASEAEEGPKEKKEEDCDEEKLPNSMEGKASKKRSRRKSFGVRRVRKRKEVEEDEVAKREKMTDGKKNKKEEKKKEKDEKEIDRTPFLVDRPVRERKSVERLVSIIEKDAHKEFKIEKGCGTPLKDIPNVASKLQRKNDDTLKLLHNLLFGQRCKAFEIRGHISRFSGFVWHDNEEKKKDKVKEKFDKCTKEKLLEICDVLDMTVSRASIKKEELVTRLIDFLVAPHPTTTVVLAEKEPSKGQKRKRMEKQSSLVSAKRSGKSRKKSVDSSKGKSRRPQPDSDNDSEGEEEEEPENEVETENGITEKSDDVMLDESEGEENDVSKHKSKVKMSGNKDSSGKAKKKKAVTVEKPMKTASSRSKVEDGDRRVSSKKNEKGIKKSPTPLKSSGKKDAKVKGKSKDATMKPSDEELRSTICEIFKEVDFSKATFTDILKQLAKQFDVDLTSRKSSIKLIIQEELTKLADEADDDEDDGEGEPEKEESGAMKVKAVAGGTEAKA